MENKLWNFLKRIGHGEPVDQEQLEGISKAIERGWEAYDRIPPAKKDIMRVELAQRLGCKSSDPKECLEFIKNYKIEY